MSWVEEIKNSSFTVAYEIDDDEVYVAARTVLVLIDLETGSPRRVGPADRAWLERFLDESDA